MEIKDFLSPGDQGVTGRKKIFDFHIGMLSQDMVGTADWRQESHEGRN
jgi:hypothetical protein